MSIDLPLSYDWSYLLLRLLFVGLIYVFIWQVLRVTMKDLQVAAVRAPQRGRSGRGSLVVTDPAESVLTVGISFPLKAKTSIGRHPDCTISIEEPFLSGFHAEITARNGIWTLTDLGSTNGTYIRGEPVLGSTDIEPGDIVQFGRIKLQLVS